MSGKSVPVAPGLREAENGAPFGDESGVCVVNRCEKRKVEAA
jgi:hypothetical protein